MFFWSAFAFFFVALGIWHLGAEDLFSQFALYGNDLPELAEGERPPFLNAERSWMYQYIIGISILFCVFWAVIERNRWFNWSVLGTTFIMIFTYFMVQISLWVNQWYGEFFDMVQVALNRQEGEPATVTIEDYFSQIKTVLIIFMWSIMAQVFFHYFTQHYVFRWRTAMNDYYTSHWPKLRKVEGAAQRVQEDTEKFSRIVERLGSAFVDSLMTLLAFLPVLWNLSQHVTELPLLGKVEGSLVFVALMSALFGTVLIGLVGYRLPGLEFNNQRVEAAYRKELVLGEDNADRAQPPSVAELYAGVRKNNFRLYFNYLYFNVFRFGYLRVSAFVPLIVLGPTIVAGAITYGIWTQISNAFNQVETSMQYLVNSWPTIIDLISIYKRLVAFESILHEDDGEADDAIAA